MRRWIASIAFWTMPAIALAAGSPVFHLDFSEFADQSGNALPIDVGDAVSLVPGGGPQLANGIVLDSGRWEGEEDETNQIIILDHPLLDNVAVSAGSIVTWIKPDDGDEWNNIAKTPCEDNIEPCDAFGQFFGIEFQASGPHAGVFGAVQGWDTNVFGPDTPLGAGGETDTPSGEWTHAALTWNDVGDHTIYVNGQPGDVVFGVGDFDFGENTPDNWTIGGDGLNAHAENSDALRYLAGELADFAIFDGELTQEEVVEIMTSGVPSSRIPGDFDGSGLLDSMDIDDLTRQAASGQNPIAYDLNGDSLVDDADIRFWISDLFNSWVGDANLDNEFNSNDLVTVLASGTYEVDIDAVWSTGDFDGTGRVTSNDLVAALADGGYEQGPRAVVASVPEPATGLLLPLAMGIVWWRQRRAGRRPRFLS